MKLVFNWTSIKGHPVSGVSTVRDAYFQTETHDRFGERDHEIQKNLECGEYGAGGGGGAGPGGPGCQYGPVCKIMQERQRTERTFPDGEAFPVLFMCPGHTMAAEPKREGGSRKGQGFYHCLAGWRCFCLEWTG